MTSRPIFRASPTGLEPAEDELAHESPLELHVGGESVHVTMRTPGSDDELVAGLLVAEGVCSYANVPKILTTAENVVEIEIEPRVFRDAWPERSMGATSSCGVCGVAAIEALETDLDPIGISTPVAARVVADLPTRLRASQPAFRATGAMHAAALFDGDGELLCSREDVGRHNAVDKVVGWAASAGELPGTNRVLAVSGRVSYEIAQKAARAGVPVIVAVSAPTSLAVDLAERFRLTICGFVRDGRFNIYSHATRIAFD